MRWLVLAVLAACSDEHGLAIRAADPPYGPLVGGTQISLTGTGFAAPARVLVGGREAPLAAVVDDGRIDVVVPPGERPGDAEILVAAGAASAIATGVFHYSEPPTLAAIAPTSAVFSSTTTVATLTGSGFLDEGAGDVTVTVDGQLATGVVVHSDTELELALPAGRALVRADLEVFDTRGRALLPRALRYTPSDHPGLLLFSKFSVVDFYDPLTGAMTTVSGVPPTRYTSVVRDAAGEYWAIDRNFRFGRIDWATQTLESPVGVSWFPTIERVGNTFYTIARNALRFGSFEGGAFTQIGTAAVPCCGSYALAYDGTTLYLAARNGSTVVIAPVDTTTGEIGTQVPLVGSPNLHVEDMRFLHGTLYAVSRDSTLVTIDPATGVTTVVAAIQRAGALEVFE